MWLTVAALVAQVYSCIYYSIFLATALLLVIPLRCAAGVPSGATRRRSFARSLPAAIVARRRRGAVPGYGYALNRSSLGERLDSDILLYSATLPNYLATTRTRMSFTANGARPFGQNERRLFPGVIATRR